MIIAKVLFFICRFRLSHMHVVCLKIERKFSAGKLVTSNKFDVKFLSYAGNSFTRGFH